MDRFIRFANEINMDDLQESLEKHNPGIMILRHSKITGTVKVRISDHLKNRAIKRAFSPHKIKQIYNDFPVKTG